MVESQDAAVAESIELDDGPIEVWPEGQAIKPWIERAILVTRFTDTARYHAELVAKVLALETDPEFAKRWAEGAGGAKVYDLPRWGSAAADLIHARALTLFRKGTGQKRAAVDISWATLYRNGDFCMPHSHLRALAGIVYFLDFGDEKPENQKSGRFLFADPRLKVCCGQEPGRMTSPSAPKLRPGTMILFPGEVIHMVNPYFGKRPRITLSWNINAAPIPGETLPKVGTRPL